LWEPGLYTGPMMTTTLLCIHRDPAQLSLLLENGYELATATTGSEGLRLFMSRSVDAVVLECHLGLLDGSVIADEIKRVRPEVPIVMVADHVELPGDALKSVDALAVNSDDPRFLLATVHFVLAVRAGQRAETRLRVETPPRLRRPGRSRQIADRSQADTPQSATAGRGTPFSPELWRSILDGVIRF